MNHTALTTPAGTPNLVNPTREPCPFTITFPSIEVALAELGQKVFGATIVIAEPCTQETTTPPSPNPNAVDLEAEAQCLHAHWHEAATEVTTLRDEVKRLANMLDKCQSGNHTRDALNKALKEKLVNWMKTAELRLGTVCCLREEKENLVAERDTLAEWKRQGLIVISKWDEVDAYVRHHPEPTIGDSISDTVLKWLKERDELKAQGAYRMLKQGEEVAEEDEFWDSTGRWLQTRVGGRKMIVTQPNFYRRKITPA